jgi:hypothetical protein
MKAYNDDTLANFGTAVSGSAAVIHFATTWQPVFSLCVAFIGIISGILAIAYYIKKLRK